MLTIIISTLAAIFGLYVSKPQRKTVAWATATLILIAATFLIYEKREADAKMKVVTARVQTEVGMSVAQYFSTIEFMILRNSDGWLPKDESEFFSEKTAELLAHHVDMDKPASMVGNPPWRSVVARQGHALRSKLERSVVESGASLDQDLVAAMDECVGLMLIGPLADAVMNMPREAGDPPHPVSPVWLPFEQGPKMLHNDLLKLRRLIVELRKVKNDKGWYQFGFTPQQQESNKVRLSERVEKPSFTRFLGSFAKDP